MQLIVTIKIYIKILKLEASEVYYSMDNNMRFALALILSVFLCTVMWWKCKQTGDFLSPPVFICLLSLFKYVPGIAYIDTATYVMLNEENVTYVFCAEIISTILMLCGFYFYNSIREKGKYYISCNYFDNYVNMKLWSIFFIGFIAGLYYLFTSNAYSYLYGERIADSGKGMAYLLSLVQLMIIAIAIYIKRLSLKNYNSINFTVILMFFMYALIYMIWTKRTPVLECILIILFLYNYLIERISFRSFFSFKSVLIVLCCVSYIIIMPLLRGNSVMDWLSVEYLWDYLLSNLDKIFVELSLVGVDAFVYTNYDYSNFWYGRNIINFLYSPLPSSLFAGKPPVDDGMYIANAIIGYFVSPPSLDLPWYNSVPLTNHSGFYITFGEIGLLLGAILEGIIYGYIYKVLKDTDYDPAMILIYELVLYKLKFSSLYMTNFCMSLLLIWGVMKYIFNWRIHYIRFK